MQSPRRAPTPRELERTAEVEALCTAIWTRQPSARCLGHLRVHSGGRVRDVILGPDSLVSAGVALLQFASVMG